MLLTFHLLAYRLLSSIVNAVTLCIISLVLMTTLMGYASVAILAALMRSLYPSRRRNIDSTK